MQVSIGLFPSLQRCLDSVDRLIICTNVKEMNGGNIFNKRPYIVVASTFLVLLILSSLFENVEWRLYDYRVQLVSHLFGNEMNTADKVVVVGIDGVTSLRDKPLIFWYPQIAEAIQVAADNGAIAIAIDLIPYHSLGEKLDVVFSELGDGGEGEILNNIGNDLDRSIIAALMRSSFVTPILQGYNGDIVPFYYGMMAHMANVTPASLLINYDADGVLRQSYPADEDGSIRLAAAVCNVTELCAAEERFLINYPLIDKIPTFEFNDFINGQIPESAIAGKIVLIGMVNGNEDLVHTPLGLYSGSYFHAVAIETLLTGSSLRKVNNLLSLSVLLLLCLLAYATTMRQKPLVASLTLLLLTAIYCAINLYVFSRGMILPAFPHLFALGLTAAITYPYKYLVEERDRKKLMETFSYYVDKSVIDQLIESDAKRLMEGEQRQVTVMSLDIRNFTSLSNSFPPEKVVELLNYMFSHFTELIQTSQGFVNKFMGDGLLAFFPGEAGPISALDCSEKLDRIVQHMNNSNELYPFIQSRQINIGIGLHHGSVILGNIGSRRKMDFTVIGPTVNLAFRIEAATKELKETILVTREVYEQGKTDYRFEPLGSVDVKGFEGKIKVYAPRSRTNQSSLNEGEL